MDDVSTSAGVDHTRYLSFRHLAVAVLAVGALCGSPSAAAHVTRSAPHAAASTASPAEESRQAAHPATTDNAPTHAQEKPALENSTHAEAVGPQAGAAAPAQQHTDERATRMTLLLGILLMLRHGA